MAGERKSLSEMVGETAREAGVLIFVFGILDGFLDDVTHGPWWYASIVMASGVFVSIGYHLELRR
jgi:hypothetical protein